MDRAALDFAIGRGLEHGGWCPRGRRAEDGRIDVKYQLRETESADYDARTRQNVLDSDATLIIVRDRRLAGGTALTHDVAVRENRPVLVIHETDGVPKSAAKLSGFLRENAVTILNVAGPRESEAPGLNTFVTAVLDVALSRFRSD